MDHKAIARERIAILLNEAAAELESNPALARRHVQLARSIATRYTVRIPENDKRRICKKCSTLLVPGKTATYRANPKQKAMAMTCKYCGSVRRYPYGKRK